MTGSHWLLYASDFSHDRGAGDGGWSQPSTTRRVRRSSRATRRPSTGCSVAGALLDVEARLRSNSFLDDPYPVYELLRAEAPVYRSEAWNGWLVTRHDHVKDVLDRPDAF